MRSTGATRTGPTNPGLGYKVDNHPSTWQNVCDLGGCAMKILRSTKCSLQYATAAKRAVLSHVLKGKPSLRRVYNRLQQRCLGWTAVSPEANDEVIDDGSVFRQDMREYRPLGG